MKRKFSAKRSGFTMIELMVSIIVVGFALLAVLLANTAIQQASERARERMIATQDAHRVVELIRNASVNGNFPANVVTAFPNGGAVAGFNNLTNEQVVASYSNTAVDPLDITVTTTWLEQGRRNALVQLRTLMTQRTNP